jgi:hypothetical protein
MKRTFCVLALLAVSCRPPLFQHPLSDPATAKVDTKLVGNWRGTAGGHPVFMHVYGKDGGHIDLVLVADDGDKGATLLAFEGFTTELGNRRFLNLRSKTAKGPWDAGWALSEHYALGRYAIDAKGALTLWQLSDDVVKEAVKAGKLKGTEKDDEITIGEETAKLAELFAKAESDKLFIPFGTFRRLAGK